MERFSDEGATVMVRMAENKTREAMSRMGKLALVAAAVLWTTGSAYAAPFNLYKKSFAEGKETVVELKRWKKEDTAKIDKMVESLKSTDEKDTKAFAAEQKKDFQIVHILQGVQKLWKDTAKDDREAVKKSLLERLGKIDPKVLGGKQRLEGLLDAVEALLDADDTKDLDALLEEILGGDNEELRRKLGVLLSKDAKPEPTKTETPVATKTEVPVATKTETPVKTDTPVTIPSAIPPAIPTLGASLPVVPANPRVGEIEAIGKAICDKLTERDRNVEAQVGSLINPLAAQFNGLVDQLAALSKGNDNKNVAKKDDLKDLVNSFLQGADKKKKNNNLANNTPPPAPLAANERSEKNPNSPFTRGLPPEATPPAGSPVVYVPADAAKVSDRPVTGHIDFEMGRAELRAGQALIATKKAQTAPKVNPQQFQQQFGQLISLAGQGNPFVAGFAVSQAEGLVGELAQQRDRIKAEVAELGARVASTTQQVGLLDEELDGLKAGAEAKMDPFFKNERIRLDKLGKARERELKELTAQATKNPELEESLRLKRSEVAQVEEAKEENEAKIRAWVEGANPNIAALKKRRDSLNANVAELNGLVTKKQGEEEQLASLQSNSSSQIQTARLTAQQASAAAAQPTGPVLPQSVLGRGVAARPAGNTVSRTATGGSSGGKARGPLRGGSLPRR